MKPRAAVGVGHLELLLRAGLVVDDSHRGVGRGQHRRLHGCWLVRCKGRARGARCRSGRSPDGAPKPAYGTTSSTSHSLSLLAVKQLSRRPLGCVRCKQGTAWWAAGRKSRLYVAQYAVRNPARRVSIKLHRNPSLFLPDSQQKHLAFFAGTSTGTGTEFTRTGFLLLVQVLVGLLLVQSYKNSLTTKSYGKERKKQGHKFREALASCRRIIAPEGGTPPPASRPPRRARPRCIQSCWPRTR